MSHPRILLVDGDRKRARYLGDAIVTATMVNPVHREDGESAVLWVGANKCDLCVLSYELRGINGLETFARMRTRQPDLPAIIFSENQDQSIAIAAFREGVLDFVPVRGAFQDVITERIQKTLDRQEISVTGSPAVMEDPTLSHVPRERLQPTYQNRLRAIGRQLDIYGFHSITVLEIDGGFIVRANRERSRRSQALEFPDRDFPRIVASAIEDEGMNEKKSFQQSNLIPTGYEDVLRALGHRLDKISANSIVITELEEMIVASGRGNDERSAVPGLVPFNYLLERDDIELMLNEAFHRRGQAPLNTTPPDSSNRGLRGIFKRLN
jgi:DNA-binding NarL/FixJ family response regulator